MRAFVFVYFLLFSLSSIAQNPFQESLNGDKKPWTDKTFLNDPKDFQFAIVTDRTGGHRKGIFGKAVEKLNLMQPEFVMCVGDLIEGYNKDTSTVNRQWAEFDSILSELEMRFFYLPGNHDISNHMMRTQWMQRYGHAYYHFRYQDVLFLSFDTNDGDAVTFSREQIDYFKQVLAENKDVRWTLLFMHHPIWNYREFNGFAEIEEILNDRPYTVYAGHNHRYLQTQRQDRNYYILATTGGGSRLLGPKFGQYDHITWITMTDQGPKMLNLQLEGLHNGDISNERTREQASALYQAAQFRTTLLSPKGNTSNSANLILNIQNPSDQSMNFSARFYHHHQLMVEAEPIEEQIASKSTQQFSFELSVLKDKLEMVELDPLALDWSLGYTTDKLEAPFGLSSTLAVPLNVEAGHLEATEMDIFTDTHQVSLDYPFEELIVTYTTDGTDPTFTSQVYQGPITLTNRTTLKARYFSPDGELQSGIMSKEYRKVVPFAAVKKSKKEKPGLTYHYYEGNFQTVPDFSSLVAKKTGVAQSFDVEAMADRMDHYAFLFEGYIEVPSTGVYTFLCHSDDGAKLFIHNELVVDNDGSHSARTRQGAIALEAGKHPIRIAYFEDFLGETLRLSYIAPEEEEPQLFTFDSLSY